MSQEPPRYGERIEGGGYQPPQPPQPPRRRPIRTVGGGIARTGDPIVTYAIIGITVLVFLAQEATSWVTNALFFVPVLGSSEPWRFLTAGLLHSGVFHILLNMYALYLVGPSLERALGRWRFIALYILSTLGGSVAVLLLAQPNTVSWMTAVVGASGAVFGLFAALVLAMRRVRQSDTQLLIVIGLNLVLGFVLSGISWQGHLGGLFTGAALGAIYFFAPRTKNTPTAIAGTVLVAALLIGAAVAKYALIG